MDTSPVLIQLTQNCVFYRASCMTLHSPHPLH